jgi:MFS transporter, SP family, inositol transporter
MNRQHDDSHVTAQQWRWTILAGMASYLDAGSIVALGVGLALWQEYLGMSSTTVGLLTALGPNAIGAAIGALIGGRLGDLFGRKRIYQYDLLVYAFGILLIVSAVNPDAPYRNLHSGCRGRRRRTDLTRADRRVLA